MTPSAAGGTFEIFDKLALADEAESLPHLLFSAKFELEYEKPTIAGRSPSANSMPVACGREKH
ncbi:hypothetical protein FRC01_002191 [Tulasnella sp. 417]|nr:hypothetical protein FRC01_002191 [Tulasnella sp. 417]